MKYDAGHFSDLADTPRGRAVWKLLNEHDSVLMMKAVTDVGRPALQPMGEVLLAEYGPDIKGHRWKQMIGHMTRQVMEHNGYQLDRQNVKLKGNAVFTSASRYKRRGP